MIDNLNQWLVGSHAVKSALDHNLWRVKKLIDLSKNSQWEKPYKELHQNHTLIYENPQEKQRQQWLKALQKNHPNLKHQNILAQVKPLPLIKGESGLSEVLKEKNKQSRPIWVAVDEVQNPQNLGALIRHCDGFGAGLIINANRCCTINATVAKAASGALEVVPMMQTQNLHRSLTQLKKQDLWVIGLDNNPQSLKVQHSLFEYTTTFPALKTKQAIIIVVGQEGAGIRPQTLEVCDELLQIPTTGSVASLNMSASVAITLAFWNFSLKKV